MNKELDAVELLIDSIARATYTKMCCGAKAVTLVLREQRKKELRLEIQNMEHQDKLTYLNNIERGIMNDKKK